MKQMETWSGEGKMEGGVGIQISRIGTGGVKWDKKFKGVRERCGEGEVGVESKDRVGLRWIQRRRGGRIGRSGGRRNIQGTGDKYERRCRCGWVRDLGYGESEGGMG